jgi:diguanylate cyclase (GGDEF)-like protein
MFYAYTAYAATLVSWSVLLVLSPFWHREIAFGIGWLFTFLIIPIYYFKLVEALHRNIKQLHIESQKSSYKALHDELTGLANRAMFEEDLKRHINKNIPFGLFFIDLDTFKEINDKYGHDIGDRVLQEAANRIHSVIHNAYRLGGDEFVGIVRYKDDNHLQHIAENLIFTLTMPCKNSNITLSASVGIAHYPFDAQREFDIKKDADIAMYAAKQAGKNRYIFFKDTIQKKEEENYADI